MFGLSSCGHQVVMREDWILWQEGTMKGRTQLSDQTLITLSLATILHSPVAR